MIVHTKMLYEVPNDVIMYHEKRIEWNILISACMPYGQQMAAMPAIFLENAFYCYSMSDVRNMLYIKVSTSQEIGVDTAASMARLQYTHNTTVNIGLWRYCHYSKN